MYIPYLIRYLHIPRKLFFFMCLACQKKNCLVCVEMTNLRIFTKPIPIFFQSTKLRQTTEDRDSWKILRNNSEFLTSTQVKYLFFWHAARQPHKTTYILTISNQNLSPIFDFKKCSITWICLFWLVSVSAQKLQPFLDFILVLGLNHKNGFGRWLP